MIKAEIYAHAEDIARSVLHDQTFAPDVAQMVYVKVRLITPFERVTKGLVARTARWVALDVNRHESSNAACERAYAEERKALRDSVAETLANCSLSGDADLCQLVHEMAASPMLSAQEQEVLSRYLQGLSLRAIAREKGTSRRKVMTAYHSAVRTLRKMLFD